MLVNLNFYTMKKLLLILGFCLGAVVCSYAQVRIPPVSSGHLPDNLPDETAVVKDSTGKRYDYETWTSMMATHRFSIRANGRKKQGDKYPEYLLYPLFDMDGHRIYTAAMKRTRPKESEQFHVGDVFKGFNEKAIDGMKFNLKKDLGKVYVINFWFIGCPPCREEIPDLNDIVEQYKNNKDVIFISICLDREEAIRDYMKINPLNYHIVDDGRSIASKYDLHTYPTNLVVGRDGKIIYSSVGGSASNPYWISKTIGEAVSVQASVAPAPSK
jgi:thiol-disulfide isomerase/thioredoxin